MRLDARLSPEYRAAMLALRTVDRTISKMVRRETKRIAAPEWTKALAERAHTRLQQRVLVNTAVITVSNQNVRAQSASKGRPLRGGFNPKTDYHAAEFGADRSRVTKYRRRSPKGKVHDVARRVGDALPIRNGKGHVFYPAAREMVPRLARLFVQTTVHTIANALEGKQE